MRSEESTKEEEPTTGQRRTLRNSLIRPNPVVHGTRYGHLAALWTATSGFLRQSDDSGLAGHEDGLGAGVGLTSTRNWSETDLLAHEENLAGLVRLIREPVARADGVGSPHWVVLDAPSSPW